MKIKEFRERKGFSHEYMAEILGINRTSYTNKENGKRKFTIEEALILEDILGVRVSELFEDLKRGLK